MRGQYATMRFIQVLATTAVAIAICAGTAQAGGLAGGFGTAAAVVTLKYHHAADLDVLINNQTDPTSPLYGKFLTPDEFRRYFAPTPAEYAATIAQLQHAGFTIIGTSPNRTIVDVSASLALVDRVFGNSATRTAQTQTAGHGAAGSLPQASFPYIDAVASGATSHAAAAPMGYAGLLSVRRDHRDHGGRNFGPAVGPDGGYGPQALIKGVNFPVRHGYDGRGVVIADIIDGPPVAADVQTFLQAFGIHRTGPPTVEVPVDGGNGPDHDVADIDSEWILSTAPGVRLYVYDISAFSPTTFVDAFNKVVSDNIADVANTSLSTCESDTIDTVLALQPILKQGAAQGIAFEAPSFGIQSQCGIPDTLFPVVPADSGDVLAVGGANAIEDGDQEVVAQSAQSMSGGGVSAIVEAFPAQLRIPGVDPSGRNTPDISLLTEINGNGPSSFFSAGWNGNFQFVNNIPISSLLAEYQQMVHHRLGAFNRTLYRMLARHGYGDGIVDLTSGCDGVYLGAPLCAKRGYDITTGIGTISDAYELGRRLRR